MRELGIIAPTYNAQSFPNEVELGLKPEYGPPYLPVLIRESEGVRLILGTYVANDLTKPDILIERQPNGWMIFLHPLPGSDPSGYIYFLDDGRSFLVPENGLGPTKPIEVLAHDEEVHEMVKNLPR